MGRSFGIVLVALGVWVAVEVYTEGMAGAFGGLFVDLGMASQEEASAPVTERAAEVWRDAQRQAQERVNRHLE
jgi:hypothetical protein